MSRFATLLEEFFYRPDEDDGGLSEPGIPLEQLAPQAPEEPLSEYLAFELETERYAVPIDSMREILKVPPMTEVPHAPKNLLGIMSLRGELLPVFDLKVRLKLATTLPKVAGPVEQHSELKRSSRVLVVRTEEGDAGILVDAVREVVKLRASAIESPLPGVGSERDGIVGIGRNKGQLYILLEPGVALA